MLLAPWITALILLMGTGACLYIEHQPLASVGLQVNGGWWRDLVLGSAIGGGAIALACLFYLLWTHSHLAHTPTIHAMDLLRGAIYFLGVACSEEILFRGWIFFRATKKAGAPLTLTLTVAVFTFSHLANPGMVGSARLWATAVIGLASCLISLGCLRRGSLALPIGIHFGWDWASGTVLGFPPNSHGHSSFWSPVLPANPTHLTFSAFGPQVALPCLAATLLAIGLVFRLRETASVDQQLQVPLDLSAHKPVDAIAL